MAEKYTRKYVVDKINEIMARGIELEPLVSRDILPTWDLRADLGADSIDTYEIMFNVEEEFNISIPDEEANKVEIMQEAYDLVLRELNLPKLNAFYAKGMILDRAAHFLSDYMHIDRKKISSRMRLWPEAGRLPSPSNDTFVDNANRRLRMDLYEKKTPEMITVGDFYRLVLSKAYPKDKQK